MKRIILTVLCLVVLLVPVIALGAPTDNNWIRHQNDVDPELKYLASKGFTFTGSGAFAFGHTYKNSTFVSNGFSTEFTLDCSGKFTKEAWFCVALMANNAWWPKSIDGKTSNDGLAILVRPETAKDCSVSILPVIMGNIAYESNQKVSIAPTKKMKVELKKNGNNWLVYVNGTSLKNLDYSQVNNALTALKDGKGHFEVGCYNPQKSKMSMTIHKVCGKSLVYKK